MAEPILHVPLHTVKWGDVTLSVRVHSVLRDADGRLLESRDADFIEAVSAGSDLRHVVVKIKARA
jgi:hypothetical protein